MQYSMRKLENIDAGLVIELAKQIYDINTDNSKYPTFQVGFFNDEENREKFFTMFMLPPHFKGFTQRQAYGIYDEFGTLVSAVGVRRYDHMPCWSLSWLLSPSIGVKFIRLFRFIIDELCKIHESANINELFLTYPANREEAYSRIMLFMRERYFTFIETTVPAKTTSPYKFIHDLMGQVLQPYDVNVRRYILRRPDMTPASEGGQAKRKQHNDE